MAFTDPERKRAYDRAYREANPEKRRAAQHAWSAANREKRRAFSRNYDEAHPEVRAVCNAHRRAKRYGVPFTLTRADAHELLAPMRCSATGLPLAHSKGQPSALSPSIDRVEPARGYVPGNVRLVCQRFNELRGTDPVSHDFRHALRVLAETTCETDRVNLPALTPAAPVQQ